MYGCSASVNWETSGSYISRCTAAEIVGGGESSGGGGEGVGARLRILRPPDCLTTVGGSGCAGRVNPPRAAARAVRRRERLAGGGDILVFVIVVPLGPACIVLGGTIEFGLGGTKGLVMVLVIAFVSSGFGLVDLRPFALRSASLLSFAAPRPHTRSYAVLIR